MSINWELPSGWETRKLASIASEDTVRIKPAETPKTAYNYWGLDAVQLSDFQEPSPNWIRGAEVASTCIRFDTSHVLYAKLRPYLNKVIVPSVEGIGSTEWVVLRPNPELLDKHYLAYVLRSPAFVHYATTNSAGARLPRIRKEALWNADVPVPFAKDPQRSLAIQRQIVARIEVLLAEVREMRKLKAEIQKDSDRLVPATIHECFRIGISRGWEWINLARVLRGKPQYGTSQKATSEAIGTPVIRMNNIQEGKLNLTDLKYVELDPGEKEKIILKSGDLLFNRSNGSIDLVGKTAVFRSEIPMVFASYLVRAVPDTTLASPEYISHFINSTFGRDYIVSNAVRSTGQANVNATKLANMPILIPPKIEDQLTVTRHIQQVEDEVLEMKKINQSDLERVKQLQEAILSQAFRGEL
jgi:type I restriction enzyme S subunit